MSETSDFFSNDYLGFARSDSLKVRFLSKLQGEKSNAFGSTGSRLISGNSAHAEKLEDQIAKFHYGQTGLLFNSGYNANIGILSSIDDRGGLILYDELCHASIREGIRLSLAKSHSFRHNDLSDLEKKITRQDSKTIFVVTEALYSMDGDFAPLPDLVEICKKYDARVILDEAHSTGIIGEEGRGLAAQQGLQDQIWARVHTFGKALGCFGAIVICDETLKQYLINRARSFIYTTGLPFFNLFAIECAYEYLEQNHHLISELRENIQFFRESIPQKIQKYFNQNESPIQACIVPENVKIKQVEKRLLENNFNVKAILSPTVPQGKERMRFSIHTFNTKDEIQRMLNLLSEIL